MYLIHPRKKGLPTYIHEDFDAIVAMLTAYGARRGYQLPEPPEHDNALIMPPPATILPPPG